MSDLRSDAYGGNYPKARKLALARSSGKCQFCGLQQAVETHHWAYPNYPSGDKVQGHDLTALCEPCHELATVLRDWVARKDARFVDLARDLNKCNTFVAKREAISYWLYPEGDDKKYGVKTFHSNFGSPEKTTTPYTPYTPYRQGDAPKRKELSLALLFWIGVIPFVLIVLITILNS